MKKPIVYKAIYFSKDRYFIDTDGTVSSSSETVRDLPFMIIHSSNGYDYGLFTTNSARGKNIYPIDEIVAFTFMRDEMLSKTRHDANGIPHVEIEHIDGNTRNNAVDNLRILEPVERWVPLIKPENVPRGVYEISSWGNVRNVKTGRMCVIGYTSGDGYPGVNLICSNSGNSPFKRFALHRLIALHFVNNPDTSTLNVVDHVDGDKMNFDTKNLQWVSSSQNATFASMSNLSNNSRITTQEIDVVISLLCELNGNVRDTYIECRRRGMPITVTEAVINNIKNKDKAYIRYDSKYDLRNIEFCKRTRKANLTDEDIHSICKKLVECNGDIAVTLQKLHEDGLTHLERHDIRHIRNKSNRSDISDLYFKKEDFSRPREPLAKEIFIKICEALVECNGNMCDALKLIHSWGFDIVTKYDVQDAKYKKRGRDISDMYFTFDNREFKVL